MKFQMATVFLIAIICGLLGAYAATAEETVLDIKPVTSPGGIEAWLVEDHSIPIIAVEFGFRGAGAANVPPEKQGLTQLLSNTLDEGAGNLSAQEFQKELRDQSISLSFSSGRDHFFGSLKTLTANRDRAFELLSLALTKPRFDEEPVQRMRAANQSRIRSSLSNPNWIAARLLNDTAYKGHPYALNAGGTLSSLENITPQDLRSFLKKHFGKNNLVIGVTGDITEEELGLFLDNTFGTLPEISAPPAPAPLVLQNKGQFRLYEKDIPQTVIEILQPGIDRTHEDYQEAVIMNFILGSSGFGSRLTKEIREKRGLTYGIYSNFIDLEAFDGLGVSTSTANENVPEMLGLIEAEWERMRSSPVSAEELADAKSYLLGSLPLSLTSTERIASLLLSIQMDDLPIDYLDRREAEIESATVEDIQRISQSLLDTAQMTTILVGNPADLKSRNDVQNVEALPNVE